MIFVTLGTHEQPFERALELLSSVNGEDELVIQHGSTPARPDLLDAEWVDYFDSDALLASMRRADVVISHAGVGSMITAIRNRKIPIVLPRLARFGEHVDDHQLQLAQRFAAQGLVLVCGPDDCIKDLAHGTQTRRSALPEPHGVGLREAVAELARRASENRTLTSAGTRPPWLVRQWRSRIVRA